jgi:hypothetical protein
MAFGVANIFRDAGARRALEPEFEDINNFLISLSPAKYPKPSTQRWPEQGAVLFHERNLWANGANGTISEAGGKRLVRKLPTASIRRGMRPIPTTFRIHASKVSPASSRRSRPFARIHAACSSWRTSASGALGTAPGGRTTSLVRIGTSYPSDDIVSSELRRVPRAVYDNGGAIYSPLDRNEWVNPMDT